jgi:hypothetical protein
MRLATFRGADDKGLIKFLIKRLPPCVDAPMRPRHRKETVSLAVVKGGLFYYGWFKRTSRTDT